MDGSFPPPVPLPLVSSPKSGLRGVYQRKVTVRYSSQVLEVKYIITVS